VLHLLDIVNVLEEFREKKKKELEEISGWSSKEMGGDTLPVPYNSNQKKKKRGREGGGKK
jgi:hypothetical protein